MNVDELSRVELQKLCKSHGMKANISNFAMKRQLEEVLGSQKKTDVVENEELITVEIVPTSGQRFKVQASHDASVAHLRQLVAANLSSHNARLRLLYAGRELRKPEETLRQAGIGLHNNFIVHLVSQGMAKTPSSPKTSSVKAFSTVQQSANNDVIVIDDDDPQPSESGTHRPRAHVSSAIDLTQDSPQDEGAARPQAVAQASRKRKAGGGGGPAAAAPASAAAPTAAAAPARRQPKPKPEKRLTRFRGSAPMAVLQRIERAKHQRLFMVSSKDESQEGYLSRSFMVMGSTGNIYKVDIQQRPTCACPDAQKGNVCKHILFVYLKVLRQHQNSGHIYQTSLLQSELQEIFDQAPANPQGCLARREVISAYKRASGEEEEEEEEEQGQGQDARLEDDCPICFEPLVPEGSGAGRGEPLTHCRDGCKKALHAACQRQWAANKRRQGEENTCVFCRAPWRDDSGGGSSGGSAVDGAVVSEGYLNLGSMQGQSAERDTSSYSSWGYHGGSSRGHHWRRRRGGFW